MNIRNLFGAVSLIIAVGLSPHSSALGQVLAVATLEGTYSQPVNNSSWPRDVLFQSKAAAYRRVSARLGPALRSSRTAAAKLAGVASRRIRPALGPVMISSTPRKFPATTGVPHAMLSSNTLGQPSREEGWANTSAAV